MNEWFQEPPLKDIAFKAIMIMPNILQQKPSKNSKAKDHLKDLERRLESWLSGHLLELLKEAETTQKSLRSKKTSTNTAEISKGFSQEMKKRKRLQRHENSNRQYEKQHFTLNKLNIKPTTVKKSIRERSISGNSSY